MHEYWGEVPVVTLLTRFPAPTAPENQQKVIQTANVNLIIPDNNTTGIASDIVSMGQPLNSIIVNVIINHNRHADLVVKLDAIDINDGQTIFQTQTLFNGPELAKTLTAKQADALRMSGELGANKLIPVSAGTRLWRLNVSDNVAGNQGRLVRWTLEQRWAVFPYMHDPAYYQGILFGYEPGGSAVKPNVRDYFRAVSREKLKLTNAGVVGPIEWLNGINWARDYYEPDNKADKQHVADVIHLLEDNGFDFNKWDKNGDNVITFDELLIVAVDNTGAGRGGANRSAENGFVTLQRSPLKVQVRVVFVPQQFDFMTLVHELSHIIGAVDLYGDNWNKGECLSYYMTLMSCEPWIADDKSIVYLDPWHRWKLGWISPDNFLSLSGPPQIGLVGEAEIGDETWRDFWGTPSRPLILRNPNLNSNEYFLFEYRAASVDYDRNVADTGLVVWHVKEDGNDGPYMGSKGDQPEGYAIYVISPDNDRGGSRAWHSTDGNFQLHWEDGTVLPLTFWVEEFPVSSLFEGLRSSNSILLHYQVIPINNLPPTVHIISPADQSSGPYGFAGVVFEAVATDSRGSTFGLTFDWINDVEGPMGSGSRIGYGFVNDGPHKVTVIVRDIYGATASKTITFNVRKTPPKAAIYSPTPNSTYLRNQPVYLYGNGSSPVSFALPCSWTINNIAGWIMNDCSGTFFPPSNLIGPATFTLT